MNTQAVRPIRLGLAALVALVSALAALAVSNGTDAHAHDTASVADVSAKELKLRNDMRVLWEDHVTWTRLRDQPCRRHPGHRCDGRAPASQPDGYRQRRQAVLRQGCRQRADE